MNNESKVDLENISVFCSSCGEKIFKGQKFCSSCGKKVNKKNFNLLSKKKLILIIGACVVLFIISYYMKMEKQKEDRFTYLKNIKNFHEDILIAGQNLESISDTIENYWKENIFDEKHGNNIDEAISEAISIKNSEIKRAESYDKEILNIYKNLQTLPRGSEDLESIRGNINSLYNTYTDFYKFATNPSGNYTQYSSTNNTKTDKFLSDYTVLSNSIKSNTEFEQVQSIKEDMNSKMKLYKELDESIDKELGSSSKVSDEKIKELITQFYGSEKSDISYIVSEKENFKENAIISNGIDIIESSTKYLNNMIESAEKYEKTNSQDDINKFKSYMFKFKSSVLLYIINVDSLDDNKSDSI